MGDGGIKEYRFFRRGTEGTIRLLNKPSHDLDCVLIFKAVAETKKEIDEDVYPPDSAIKPAFVKRVKKAQGDIAAGKGKTYDSIDEFIHCLED